MGRSRSRQQLRGRHRRKTDAPRDAFLQTARRRLPGVLRAHAVCGARRFPRGSTCSSIGACLRALARFSVLDTRQYRTDQPCGDGKSRRATRRSIPEETMMVRRRKRGSRRAGAVARALEHPAAAGDDGAGRSDAPDPRRAIRWTSGPATRLTANGSCGSCGREAFEPGRPHRRHSFQLGS